MRPSTQPLRGVPCRVPGEMFFCARWVLFGSFAIPCPLKFGSLRLSRFVLAWSRRANERVRSGLDGVREFLEILAHVAQIFEQLVDVVGVHVKRLVQTPG